MHNARILCDYYRLCVIFVCHLSKREKKKTQYVNIARLSSLGPCGHASCLDMEVVLKVKTNIIYVTAVVRTRGFDTKYGNKRRLSTIHVTAVYASCAGVYTSSRRTPL